MFLLGMLENELLAIAFSNEVTEARAQNSKE
jgi:hypothetical protein